MATKTLDLTQIKTRRQALKALKDLGYTDPGYTMTRGTKLMTGYDLSVTLAPENFMVLDKRGELSFIPMCLVMTNTGEHATEQLVNIFAQLVNKGVMSQETTQLPLMGLAVGIAMLGLKRQAVAA